jgi:two-component system sensor histidine kinase AlgZ
VTEITVAVETSEAMVPYLLLQPLVENAIKHGVSRIRGMGKIEISISRDAGNLSIAVVNDSNTASPVPEQERLGIGIENIRSRLRMLYGLKGELTVQELPGGRFRVEARFPFEAITTPGSEAQFAAPTLRPGMEIGQ